MFYIFIYLLFMFSAYGLGLLFLFKCDIKPLVKTLAKELYSNKASTRSDAILKLEDYKLVKIFSKILSSAENNFISNAIICISLFSKNIPEAKLELINKLQNKRINSLNRLQIAKSILLLENNDLAINYVTKELKHRDLEIRQKAATILKEMQVET